MALSKKDKLPRGISSADAYNAIRTWYSKNATMLKEGESLNNEYKQDSLKLINKLSTQNSLNNIEIRAVFREVITGLLEWAYHESDGKYKMAAYAHAALKTENASYILNEIETAELRKSSLWPFLTPGRNEPKIHEIREPETQPLSHPEVNLLNQKPAHSSINSTFTYGQGVRFSRAPSPSEHCLNIDTYARILARLFRLNNEGEFSLAIFGHWGRGKSFLLEQTARWLNEPGLIKEIEDPKNSPASNNAAHGAVVGSIITVSFSAWKFPSRPEVWIHLYESIYQKLYSYGRWKSLAHIIRTGIERHGYLKLIGLWITLWITALPKGWLVKIIGEYFDNYIKAFDTFTGLAAIAFAVLFIHGFWRTKATLETSYLKTPRHSEKLGLQATIGEDLRALLRGWIDIKKNWSTDHRPWIPYWSLVGLLCVTVTWRSDTAWQLGVILSALILIPAIIARIAFDTASPSPSRLLLVVDDLDRCPLNHLLSVIESIKLLNEDPEVSSRMRVAILIEEDVLKHAIWDKYKGLLESNAANALGTRYSATQIISENCEKLFTAHLRLPSLTPREVEEVVNTFGSPMNIDPNPLKNTSAAIVRPPSRSDEPLPIKSIDLATLGGNTDSSDLNSNISPVKDHADPSVALSMEEKRIICEQLKEANERIVTRLGPRAIRAYMFRYQLARMILQALNHPPLDRAAVIALSRALIARSLFNEKDIKLETDYAYMESAVNQVA